MMLPYLQYTRNKSKKYTVNFRGLNLGMEPTDGEFTDTLNLSTANYPVLSQRASREEVSDLINPVALFASRGLCYFDNEYFYYNGVAKGALSGGKKQIVSLGSKIIIFPDKVYYDEINDIFGSLEAEARGAVTFTDHTITGITFRGFSAGDGLTISGCINNPSNNKTLIVREVTEDTLTFYDNSFIAGNETNVIIRRDVPDLDFICTSNNRLWGVHNNIIYASKPGSPENFNVFDGLSDDSYQLTCGTPGEFTGALSYGSYVIFFKEDSIYKIYGTKPSNYQLVSSNCEGLQAGSEKSLKIINETIFYKSINGIMAYTGSVPELISEAFGNNKYSDAVCGSDNERYYCSLRQGDKWQLFVYDVLRGLWIKEDNSHVSDFAYYDGHLYFIDGDKLYKMASGNEVIEWSATFDKITETMTEKKGYSRLTIRAELEKGAFIDVEIKSDNGAWKKVFTKTAYKANVFTVAISPPTRCDSFGIRLSGKGKCNVYTITREVLTLSEK